MSVTEATSSTTTLVPRDRGLLQRRFCMLSLPFRPIRAAITESTPREARGSSRCVVGQEPAAISAATLELRFSARLAALASWTGVKGFGRKSTPGSASSRSTSGT